MERSTWRPSWRAAAAVGGYVVVTVVMLMPVLVSPLMADDLHNPYSQFDDAGGGPAAAFRFGWDASVNGGSFRILGTVTGAMTNWILLSLDANAGVAPQVTFAVTKYLVLVACAGSIAWLWHGASALWGRQVSTRRALLWSSLVLFSTVQIHAIWSNDPVANYPLAGYGAAAIGIGLMAMAVRTVRRPSAASLVGTVVWSVAAVMYYEILIGAIVGAFVLMAAGWWRRSDGGRSIGLAVAGVAVAAFPAAVVLAGRRLTGERAATYAGTTVRLAGAGRTFVRGALTSLPGAGWPLSADVLGGRPALVTYSVATVALVVVAALWARAALDPSAGRVAALDAAGADGTDLDADADADADVDVDVDVDPAVPPVPPVSPASPASPAAAGRSLEGRWWIVLVAIAGLSFAGFSLAIQAVTVKVQDEAPRVGYVYTWYAMTSAFVAAVLAIGAEQFARRAGRVRREVVAVAVVVGSVFVVFQNSVNWRLVMELRSTYSANIRLVQAFDEDLPEVNRCAALLQWRLTKWPDYYVSGITDGLDEAFRDAYGEPFCRLLPSEG